MYRKLRAFAPVDLLIIIAVIALLVAILLPSCSRARELSKRTVCASNMRGLGQANYIYAQDGDYFAAALGTSDTGAVTFCAYRKALPKEEDAIPSTTADLWILIRANNATPKQFICPSTTDQPDPAQDQLAFFDFKSSKNLSYAYQYMHMKEFKGLLTASDPTAPLMADANPYIKGGVTTAPKADRESRSRGNSKNHTNREGGNFLFVDGHVDFLKAPDCGSAGKTSVAQTAGPRGRDNAYTVHKKGKTVDAGTTAGFPDKVELGDEKDSCLVP